MFNRNILFRFFYFYHKSSWSIKRFLNLSKNPGTGCIACPSEKHPEEWYCSWKFFIN
ncbi:MAG TPA: hypothetical protein PKK00_02210 [Bacteroidales bacterium]|nr:hypothetical protein [Bacteroidales bacterium]HPS15758.1 hypothetical protein [Bacteroidales bacterium]